MMPFLKLTIQRDPGEWYDPKPKTTGDRTREALFRVWLFLVGCLVLGSGLGVAVAACLFIVRTFIRP
jgi:hypothetical protein